EHGHPLALPRGRRHQAAALQPTRRVPRDESSDPHPRAALPRRREERRARDQPRVEGHRHRAGRRIGRSAAGPGQPRKLDAALPRRRAPRRGNDECVRSTTCNAGQLTGRRSDTMRSKTAALALLFAAAAPAAGQANLPQPLRQFVVADEPVIALTHVRLVDGTGAPARNDQTIIIRQGRIDAVGPSSSTPAPAGARVMDLTGHTVIPGLVGLHDHMYSSSALGSMKPMMYSYPRLFLAAGVTTIRTTGSVDPYQELNLKAAIEAGE